MQPRVAPECCSSSVVPGARLAAVVVSAESVLAISHALSLRLAAQRAPWVGTAYDYHRLKTRCDTPPTAAGITDGSAPEIPPLSLCIGPEIPVLVVHCDLAAAEIRLHGHIGRSSLVFE